jgi:hypothetical protein
MTREELMQDLAYARTLAEEGRHAPLLGGAYLMFWGGLNALAFVGHFSILEGYLPWAGGAAFPLLWLSYGAVAGIGMYFLRRRTSTLPGLTTIGTRAERAMWGGAALALFAVVFGSIARMIADQDPAAPNAIVGAAFALYGAVLFGVAVLSEQIWLKRFGWLSIAIAASLCLFANENWAYLIAATGSILVLFWPGVILLRREPSTIV